MTSRTISETRGPGRGGRRRAETDLARTRVRAAALLGKPDSADAAAVGVPAPAGGATIGSEEHPTAPAAIERAVPPAPERPDRDEQPIPAADRRRAPSEDGGTPHQGRLPFALRARLACQDALSGWILPRCGIEPRTLAAAGVVLAVAVGFAVHHYWTGRPQDFDPGDGKVVAAAPEPVSPPAPSGPPTPADHHLSPEDPAAATSLVVDVAGEVVDPGLRTLPPGSRVGDAIDAAGGPVPGAETDLINRARPLTDGEHIVVGGDAHQPGDAPAPVRQGFDSQGKVRLNTATADDLEELPGVGPVLAGSIIAHREQHGQFTSVDQLIAVSGIGETRLADLRERMVL